MIAGRTVRPWVLGGPHSASLGLWRAAFESSDNTGLIHVLLQELYSYMSIIDKYTILQFCENIPLVSDFLRVLNEDFRLFALLVEITIQETR